MRFAVVVVACALGCPTLLAEDSKAPQPDTIERSAIPAIAPPLKMLAMAQQRCRSQIQSYHCTFEKQERLSGDLKRVQHAEVRYRALPRSVYMNFTDGISEVRRCAWVAGRDRDWGGNEQARVEPAGALIRLVVDEVKVPIHGPRARAASRHYLDQFGFHAVLDRLIADNKVFGPAVRWEAGGSGVVDGRATHILVRRLPYEGVGGRYPDAMMRIHLDAEWLAPVLIESFADPQGATLLGRYETRDVRLNARVDDSHFEL